MRATKRTQPAASARRLSVKQMGRRDVRADSDITMKKKLTAPKGPKAARRSKPYREPLFRSTKTGRFALKVFQQMFRVVGRVFAPEFVGSSEWYLKSSWTNEQENEFLKWVIREGMKTMRWGKRQASKE